ncbi:MAG: electron transfer flavoprotein subunit beta/FixA family protein, partial [Actinobacteria bacterium]|nr:electron transfer flavoprotein subunit beta/FixA family protein [Actinomycetota bacterium]
HEQGDDHPSVSSLRILVSFKVTPDFEALREADWLAGASHGAAHGSAHGVETRYVRRVLNCFDESALEMALRLSDARAERGAATGLGALSVGGRETEPYLKTLLALGYERAARVEPEAALDFAPAVVASLIASYVQRVDRSDLVMLGCRAGPGDSGTVPFLVAEALGWPCLTQVLEVEPLPDDRVRVACLVDDGLLRATIRLPCVLAVGNALVSQLRVPTLTDRLARKHARVDVLSGADLGVDIGGELRRETCVLTGLEAIDRARRGVIVGGATPREQAQALFDSHLRRVIAKL